jgi:hypothetical protein
LHLSLPRLLTITISVSPPWRSRASALIPPRCQSHSSHSLSGPEPARLVPSGRPKPDHHTDPSLLSEKAALVPVQHREGAADLHPLASPRAQSARPRDSPVQRLLVTPALHPEPLSHRSDSHRSQNQTEAAVRLEMGHLPLAERLPDSIELGIASLA